MQDLKDSALALKTIRAVAGAEGIEALRELKGGAEIWIPLRPGPDHWMSRLFGVAKAQEISRRLTIRNADGRDVCNVRVYISRGETAHEEFSRSIDEKIIRALDNGVSVRRIAVSLKITEKRVYALKRVLGSSGRKKIDHPEIDEEKAVPTRQEIADIDQNHVPYVKFRSEAETVRDQLLQERKARGLEARASIKRKKAAALECFRHSMNIAQTALAVGTSSMTAGKWRLQFILDGELDPSIGKNRRFRIPPHVLGNRPAAHDADVNSVALAAQTKGRCDPDELRTEEDRP